MKNYSNTKLKNRIQQLCKEKGIRQKELAERIGITRATFSDNIRGDMRLSTVEKIAKALDVSMSDLFK